MVKLLRKTVLWLLLLGAAAYVCVSCGPMPGDGNVTASDNTTAPQRTDTDDAGTAESPQVTVQPPDEPAPGTGIGGNLP